MMPALALTEVLDWEVIRAVIEPPPESDCQANWNWSDDPKMSAPDAVTVKLVPARAVLPASLGAPMSAQVQPAGQAPAMAFTGGCFWVDAARPGAAPALQEINAATTATTVVTLRSRRMAGRRRAGPGTARAAVDPDSFENMTRQLPFDGRPAGEMNLDAEDLCDPRATRCGTLSRPDFGERSGRRQPARCS
jgi:hypothetical protein